MSQVERTMCQAVLRDLEAKRIAEAFTTCQELNSLFPKSAEGWWLSGIVAGKQGKPEKALDCVDRALALQPGTPKYLIAKANVYIGTRRITEAVEVAQQVVAVAPGSPPALDLAGAVFSRCGDYINAKACYEKAISVAPDNSHHHYNLAAVNRYLGDDAGAETAWDKVISLNPGDHDAYHLRSEIRTQTPDNNHIEELTGLWREGISDWRGEMKICFALAKEHEDIHDYEASFSWLNRACKLRRSHMSYQVENDVQTIDGIIDAFSAAALSQCEVGHDNSEPIFVVGLPRTGTTLVERILGSHEQVHSAGELNNFALQMTRISRGQGDRTLSRRELLQRCLSIDFAELGRAYIDSTRAVTGRTPHFIDKMPLNFLYCGLIHQALPKARIIHVTRDPMDACYAMYKRLFTDAYPMSYDLGDLGRYYVAYRKLMRHWDAVLPGVIYPVSYETLVNDQEATSRRLIDHCGLEWQQACLRFEENTAPSTTASASQVRQPIYRSSLGKWRNYEAQLAPLTKLLESEGVDVHQGAY